MYFAKFPVTFYSLDNGLTVQLVRNIFLRVVIGENLKQNFSYYDEYDVIDGETPEIVAYKFYSNAQLHWIILHFNDVLDPRFGWVLSQQNLLSFCQGKYTNINGVHHYENSQGYIVNSNASGAVPVTNFDHENRLNEEKRRIKILKPAYIEIILKEIDNKLEIINV